MKKRVWTLIFLFLYLSGCRDQSDTRQDMNTSEEIGGSELGDSDNNTTGNNSTEDSCTSDECGPAPRLPNMLCPDGVNMSGPAECQRLEGGTCGYPILECPEEVGGSEVSGGSEISGGSEENASCTLEECGPAPRLPNMLCPDGVNMSGPDECQRLENGECGYPIIECPVE